MDLLKQHLKGLKVAPLYTQTDAACLVLTESGMSGRFGTCEVAAAKIPHTHPPSQSTCLSACFRGKKKIQRRQAIFFLASLNIKKPQLSQWLTCIMYQLCLLLTSLVLRAKILLCRHLF